jgi:Fur family ferric uptake transcriptional regulator
MTPRLLSMFRTGPSQRYVKLHHSTRSSRSIAKAYTVCMDLPPVSRPRAVSAAADGAFRPSQLANELTAMAPLCAVFRRFLKSRDLKYTPERAGILNAIIERDGVFEVEELLAQMRQRGYHGSKATVYRTIKLLQDAGIITQALFDSKQSHYQLIYGREPRDFMVCMKTGRHIEFSNDELVALRDRICRTHGWDPIGHRFQIYAISPEGRTLANDEEPLVE